MNLNRKESYIYALSLFLNFLYLVCIYYCFRKIWWIL